MNRPKLGRVWSRVQVQARLPRTRNAGGLVSDDVGLHCLDCAAPLQPATDPHTHVCPQTHGTLVLGKASKPLLTMTAQVSVDRLAELLARPGPRRRPCAVCGENMSDIVIHRVSIDLCGKCGATWIPHGSMLQLTGGAKEEPSVSLDIGAPPKPDAPPERVPNEWAQKNEASAEKKSGSSSTILIGIGVSVAVACVAGAAVAGYLVFGGDSATKTAEKTPLEVFDDYNAYFVNTTFGGQTLAWWQKRAEALAPGGAESDADGYRLLQRRGSNAGLEVKVVDGVVAVTPDDRMKIALVKRMKLDQ